jgi:hypothetical protein
MSEPQKAEPTANHDNRGRFVAGNRAAAGNPVHKKMAEHRRAILEALTDAEVVAVIRKLYDLAVGGDVAAARTLLDRLAGPAQALDIESRLVDLENRLNGGR